MTILRDTRLGHHVGVEYAPGFPDSQGDYMTAEELEQMAYNFVRESHTSKATSNKCETTALMRPLPSLRRSKAIDDSAAARSPIGSSLRRGRFRC